MQKEKNTMSMRFKGMQVTY